MNVASLADDRRTIQEHFESRMREAEYNSCFLHMEVTKTRADQYLGVVCHLFSPATNEQYLYDWVYPHLRTNFQCMNVTQVARYTKGPQETAEETAMIFINDKHILLGRGKGPNGHPGNIRMRRIVDKYRTQYHEVERTEKRLVVRKVHDEVISGGTKFLKRSETEDGWEEVTVNIALEKVGHSLRCFKRRSKGRGVNRSNPVTSRNESSVPSEITATLNATSPPRMRSSQGVGQDRMPGLQYVPGMTSTMTSTPTEAGLFPSVPLLRNGSVRFGVSSLLPNQSSSLDAYLRGMERNRLLSELVVARTVHLPALSGTLSDAFSSRQLYGVMEQEQQIRQLLLRQHFMASQNRELPPWYSG